MHSMSGSAGVGGGGADHGGGQLYEDHQPANGFVPLGDDKDAGSMFFQNSASGAGRDAPGFTPSYASITDYLQGFLDPVRLARHLDAPPVYAAAGQELSVGDMIGHDGRHGHQAGRGGTPNSSTSGEQENEERRRCKRGSAEEGDQEGEIDEEKSADHPNTRSDTKKNKGKVEKKARGSRVAFATKSEVDHLDDGYRWRKYGQKAVKNSTFPRSYYRCTAARCGVKKQVERSQQDPSTVVTTYEGHHAHPSPAARGMATGLYSMASLQQQRHGMYPSSTDDLFLAAARAMAPPAADASPAVPLPRHAELSFAEYYGMQLQDALLDPLAGNQHGHR